MTPLSRGIISSGKLDAGGGGGPFAVSMADMTAPAQWISGTKSVALQGLNSDQTWSTRVKFDDVGVGSEVSIMTLNIGAFNGRASQISLQNAVFNAISRDVVGTGTVTSLATGATASTGTWYHVALRMDFSGGGLSLFVNGTKTNVALSAVSTDIGSAGYDIGLGSYTDTSYVGNLDGSQGVSRVWDRALSDAEVTEDFNGSADEYICYDNLSVGLLSGLLFDSDLGTYTGHTTALAENTGNSTLTNNGLIPFTGFGLSADC